MKKCPYCGDSFPDEEKICPYCGTELQSLSKKRKRNKRKKRKHSVLPKIFGLLLCLVLIAGIAFLTVTVLNRISGNSDQRVGEISFKYPEQEHAVLTADSESGYLDNQLLIVGKQGTTRSQMKKLVSSLGGRIVGCIELTGDYQIEFKKAMSYDELSALAEQVSQNELVEMAMVHYLVETEENSYTVNDAEWADENWDGEPDGKNWNMEAIHAAEAWEKINDMNAVHVGVIDGMFDTKHEDLVDVFDKVWNNPTGTITDDHGTHVAGIIGAMHNNTTGIAGVCPKLLLFGYSMFGETDPIIKDNNKTVSSAMEFKYALALLVTSGCRSINVSLGVSLESNDFVEQVEEYYSSFIRKLVAVNYDFLIVQAAGNESKKLVNEFSENPSNELAVLPFGLLTDSIANDHVIVVGNVGRREGNYFVSPDSNYGNLVDIVAPGVNIRSTVPTTDDGKKYDKMSGTSMAAPHVTGVAAMCYAINPSLSGAEVKRFLIETPETEVLDTAHTDLRNYPLLDAEAAVEAAEHYARMRQPEYSDAGVVMGSVFTYNRAGEKVSLSEYGATAFVYASDEADSIHRSPQVNSTIDDSYELALEEGTYTLQIVPCIDGELFTDVSAVIENVQVVAGEVTYLDDVYLGASLTGTVLEDSRKQPALEGVSVRIYPAASVSNPESNNTDAYNMTERLCVTDESGSFRADILPPGNYAIELSKDGYESIGFVVTIDDQKQDSDAVDFFHVYDAGKLLMKRDYRIEDQIQCLVDHYYMWNGDTALCERMSYVFYANYFLTDLDHDGLLEITVSSTQGSGHFTFTSMYEVNETIDGLTEIAFDLEDYPETFTDLTFGYNDSQLEFTGYYNPVSDTYYYFAENTWRAGVREYGKIKLELSMIDNQIQIRTLGAKTVTRNSAYEENTSYKIEDTEYGSEEAWIAAVQEQYRDCEEFTYYYRNLSNLNESNMYNELLELAEDVLYE